MPKIIDTTIAMLNLKLSMTPEVTIFLPAFVDDKTSNVFITKSNEDVVLSITDRIKVHFEWL